jgi:hypothetical protein
METSWGTPNAEELCPKCVQKYRNLESLEFRTFTGEIPYFFRFFPFLRNLHTVEVTGSNPLSPTKLYFSLQCLAPEQSQIDPLRQAKRNKSSLPTLKAGFPDLNDLHEGNKVQLFIP